MEVSHMKRFLPIMAVLVTAALCLCCTFANADSPTPYDEGPVIASQLDVSQLDCITLASTPLDTGTFDAYCGGESSMRGRLMGRRGRGGSGSCGKGGCGTNPDSAQGLNVPPRINPADIVEKPPLTTAAFSLASHPKATVLGPDLEPKRTDAAIGQTAYRTERNMALRRHQVVLGVPTESGYFYERKKLGLLGMRGVQEQFHEYGKR
jgi:hypothetical protein